MNLQLFFRKLIKFENVRWIFNKRALGKARNNTPFPKALYCYPDKIIIPNSPPNSLSLHGISPFYIAGLPPPSVKIEYSISKKFFTLSSNCGMKSFPVS